MPGARRALAESLAAGNVGVSRIPGKHGQDRRFSQIVVMVDDRPGELGRLLSEMGEVGVNMEDLRLEHSPGAPIGLAEISVLPEVEDHLSPSLRPAAGGSPRHGGDRHPDRGGHRRSGRQRQIQRSRAAARRLGFDYQDTGAAYRAAAWTALEAGVDLEDADAIIGSLDHFDYHIGTDPDHYFVRVGSVDVTDAIREPRVTAVVSRRRADSRGAGAPRPAVPRA